MPYKKRGQRKKLLDLARKSRERAQAKRAAKTAAVNRANRLISGASPKTSSKSKIIRNGKTKITVNGKPSPHLRTAPKKPSHGRVIPKDITGRTAKSIVKPPTGKKAKPVQRPKPSYVSSWQKLGEQRGRTREERRDQFIRASRPTARGGGVPGGRKGFLGIKNLTADKYKQAQLRAKGKRIASSLAMKIPGSMSTKTAGRIGTGLEIGGSVLMLVTPAAPVAIANFKRYAATNAGKEFLKRGGTIKKWFSTAFKGKKNPFKDLSGSKGKSGKDVLGPPAPKPPKTPKTPPTESKPFKVGGRTGTERPMPTGKKAPTKKPAAKKKASAKKTNGKKPVEKLSKKELVLDYIARGGKRKKPTGKTPTKPRITKVPRRKSAVKKAPAKKKKKK